jgi:rRNA maturation RNase YbeY
MDSINFNFIDIEIPDFDPEFFALWLTKVVASYERHIGEIAFVFCSDDYLLKMNQEHLGHDYYTDVITFDYCNEEQVSGDVFISFERVIENAGSYGNKNVFDELCRVVVHGVLHLIGFNDKGKEEASVMRLEETKNLSLR